MKNTGKTTCHKVNSKPLYRKLLIPMLILSILQVGVFFGTLAVGGEFKLIKNYAYNMFVEKTENRKTYVENQIEVLEGLLCDSIPKPKGAKVGKFSKEMRAEIKKRLHKMSPEKAESSLHDVKMGKITIFDWLKEPDVVSKRDEEYERVLKAAGKERAHA